MEQRYPNINLDPGSCQLGSAPGKLLNKGSREGEYLLRLHHSCLSCSMLQDLRCFRGPVLRRRPFAHGSPNSCQESVGTILVGLQVRRVKNTVTETVSRN